MTATPSSFGASPGRPPSSRLLARAGLLLALGAGVAGCANPRADEAMRAQDVLVGMPVETLLSCAGVPARRASVDNSEYFTYVGSRTVGGYGPTTSLGFGFGSGGSSAFGLGLGVPLGGGGGTRVDGCEATFTIRNGVVQQVRYTGVEGASDAAQCYPIVENCLAIAPAPLPPAGG
jgi:hypothetical protein